MYIPKQTIVSVSKLCLCWFEFHSDITYQQVHANTLAYKNQGLEITFSCQLLQMNVLVS